MKFQRFLILTIPLLCILAACQGNDTPTTALAPAAEEFAPPPDGDAGEPTAAAETVPRLTPTMETVPKTEADEAEALMPTAAPTLSLPTVVSETAVSQPITENVTIEATDGLLLHATYYSPGGNAPFPGVILLHMLGSDRQVWAEVGFAESLVADGYAVLALDMRGHGESGSDRDWTKADEDLLRVWHYFVGLHEVDGGRTAVIGASIGSNMALRTGANEPAIKAVALLSPGLDYRRVTTDDAIIQYGDRPLLIVASEEDTYAADSSQTLAEAAAGDVILQLYAGAGHGTNMFGPQPDLADLLLDWVNQYLHDS